MNILWFFLRPYFKRAIAVAHLSQIVKWIFLCNGGLSAGLRLPAGTWLFLNHWCVLVPCPFFLLPLSLWVLHFSPRAASLQISWEDGAMMKLHCYTPYLSANLGLFLFRHGFDQQGYWKLYAEFISGRSPSLAHKRKSSKGFSGCF